MLLSGTPGNNPRAFPCIGRKRSRPRPPCAIKKRCLATRPPRGRNPGGPSVGNGPPSNGWPASGPTSPPPFCRSSSPNRIHCAGLRFGFFLFRKSQVLYLHSDHAPEQSPICPQGTRRIPKAAEPPRTAQSLGFDSVLLQGLADIHPSQRRFLLQRFSYNYIII